MGRVPIVRPVSWPRLAVNLSFLVALVTAGIWLNPENGFVLGAAAYLILALTLRSSIAREHRTATGLVKRGEFAAALPHYQASLDFFTRHPWVDRWRAVTMLSAAALSYEEMALVSMAFCYAQTGDGKRAREYYEQCLAKFPDNSIARAALHLMDAAVTSARAQN